jgi:hypothetical protein
MMNLWNDASSTATTLLHEIPTEAASKSNFPMAAFVLTDATLLHSQTTLWTPITSELQSHSQEHQHEAKLGWSYAISITAPISLVELTAGSIGTTGGQDPVSGNC